MLKLIGSVCTYNPCKNGADCQEVNPCLNGSTCNTNISFICSCSPQYCGDYCEKSSEKYPQIYFN